ncbi:MAG: type II toxin-antitoxin system HicB family antitoxin [Chloroflexota bacterium]|nr:type II toxin-antitoxin system HicB family antitoxin [Chloroflexota bacterium]
MARYTVPITFDPDGPGNVVSVPTLPGCFTQSRTVDEALVRAREAIAGHVAALRDVGESIPIEIRAPIVTSVDAEPAACRDARARDVGSAGATGTTEDGAAWSQSDASAPFTGRRPRGEARCASAELRDRPR